MSLHETKHIGGALWWHANQI